MKTKFFNDEFILYADFFRLNIDEPILPPPKTNTLSSNDTVVNNEGISSDDKFLNKPVHDVQPQYDEVTDDKLLNNNELHENDQLIDNFEIPENNDSADDSDLHIDDSTQPSFIIQLQKEKMKIMKDFDKKINEARKTVKEIKSELKKTNDQLKKTSDQLKKTSDQLNKRSDELSILIKKRQEKDDELTNIINEQIRQWKQKQ